MRMAVRALGDGPECREDIGSGVTHGWSMCPRKPALSGNVTQDEWVDLTEKRRLFESFADGRGDCLFLSCLPAWAPPSWTLLWWEGSGWATRRTSAGRPWCLVRLPRSAGSQRLGGNQLNLLPSPDSRLPSSLRLQPLVALTSASVRRGNRAMQIWLCSRAITP